MDFLRDLFNREDDEALFFILVFFTVFISSFLSSGFKRAEGNEPGEILFFIVFIVMLFINTGLLGKE
ncbi:MAG TPA: hypothetical protein VHT34_00700 [Clostridia bacterium]|nr:hypothetical protein [Clostridia bacterium]